MVGNMKSYRDLLFKLLPSGKVFARTPDSVLGKLITALGAELSRIDTRARELITEADPLTALETLDRWERIFLVTPSGTVANRQGVVGGLFTAYGGQTKDYLIAQCAAIGVNVTIDEYPNFEPPPCNAQTLTTDQKRHCFLVTAPNTGTILMRSGMPVGLPLRQDGVGSPVPSLINALKPTHTFQAFRFT
jgi:uncharacterized protein YmfQ (DUF2313 family)